MPPCCGTQCSNGCILLGVSFFALQDILALTGADAAEGLDPAPIGRAMKRFRAGTMVGAPQVRIHTSVPVLVQDTFAVYLC